MLIVSTFEKLTASLSFLSCTEGRQFEFVTSGEKETEINDVKIVDETGGHVEEKKEEGEVEGVHGEEEEEEDAVVEEDEKDDKHLKSGEEDSGSDIEIISDLKISTVRYQRYSSSLSFFFPNRYVKFKVPPRMG